MFCSLFFSLYFLTCFAKTNLFNVIYSNKMKIIVVEMEIVGPSPKIYACYTIVLYPLNSRYFYYFIIIKGNKTDKAILKIDLKNIFNTIKFSVVFFSSVFFFNLILLKIIYLTWFTIVKLFSLKWKSFDHLLKRIMFTLYFYAFWTQETFNTFW